VGTISTRATNGSRASSLASRAVTSMLAAFNQRLVPRSRAPRSVSART